MSTSIYSQQQNSINITPKGAMDQVFDQYGKQYKLIDLLIDNQNSAVNNKSLLLSCSNTSYFNLYFEPGCGMEDVSNPLHNQRRAVICKVFEDVSNFIVSPLSTTGNKVNIWVRNINNLNTNVNGYLGFASSFYNLPANLTQGGIADNEIWKTIHSGQDSYLNTTVPLTPLGASTNQAGFFYHGMVTFNFNDTASPPIPNTPQAINWNTNVNTTTIPITDYDLYSVVLHEVTHALGFTSLIDINGNSVFGANYKYFSRYDTFLKTNNLANFLLTTTACSIMYNNTFNTSINNSVLHPNSSSSTCTSNTLCADAIKFNGSTIVPVFTPNCFQPKSSLSHFEDSHFPSCNSTSPYGNDAYFLMCNSGSSGVIRRYLKPAERSTICDIGYNVKTTFGVSGAYINGTSTSFSYGGTNCAGIQVAGTNDGINTDGSYTFIGTVVGSSATIQINCNTLLSNDKNATGGLECLQDLTETIANPTTFSATSGTVATTITFTSNLAGLHLLRYVPISTGGVQKGNITYVYVYVIPIITTCTTTPSSCNLVNNGNFEANNVTITNENDFYFNKVCNWQPNGFSERYYFQNSSTPLYSIPCNEQGFQNDKINNNKAYAGIVTYSYSNGSQTSGILNTRLTNPLTPNTTYQLRFDISQAEFYRYRNYQLQAFITNINPANINGGIVTNLQISNGILLSNAVISSNSNDWETATINFTTPNILPNNYQNLYIGVLNNPLNASGVPPTTVTNCVNNFNLTPQNGSVYYIDNVSLLSNPGTLNLPNNVFCETQLNSNLTSYVSNAPLNGVFTGNGITLLQNGTYNFNPILAGNGLCVITYTYSNLNGCPISISSSINVSLVDVVIIGNPIVCLQSAETYTATVSGGQWISSNTNIAVINVNTGELTPVAIGTVTITYKVSNNCSAIVTQEIAIVNSSSVPQFNLQTTYCKGSQPALLPTISNNNIEGTWEPNIIDTETPLTYVFTPSNSCVMNYTATISIINGGDLVTYNDNYAINYSTNSQISPSIIINDTFNNDPLTSNYLGLTIVLQDPTYGITVNNDGTLNILAGLALGTYEIKYYLKNDCLFGGASIIKIKIINPTIVTPLRTSINKCYSPTAFSTIESLLDNVSIGGVAATSNNINIIAASLPMGFSINSNGTINVPANVLPGTYTINYSLCPFGSSSNCSTGLVFQLFVDTTVRANPDIFYFDTNGLFLYSNNGSSQNIIANDGYSANCGYNAPNSFGQAVLNSNVTNLTINYAGLQGKFNINNATGIVNYLFGTGTLLAGTYPFSYSICDAIYPNIVCSSASGWISVSNEAKTVFSNSKIKILEKNKVIISPNPSDGIYNVIFKNKIEKGKIEIFSIVGQKLKEINISNVLENIFDLSGYSDGTYLIKITDEINTYDSLIIKR